MVSPVERTPAFVIEPSTRSKWTLGIFLISMLAGLGWLFAISVQPHTPDTYYPGLRMTAQCVLTLFGGMLLWTLVNLPVRRIEVDEREVRKINILGTRRMAINEIRGFTIVEKRDLCVLTLVPLDKKWGMRFHLSPPYTYRLSQWARRTLIDLGESEK